MAKLAFGGHIGIGFESTFGTPVARTKFARFIDADVTRSHGEEYPDTSRLSGREDAVLGNWDPRVSALIEARPETIGPFLRAHAGTGSVATAQPDAGGHPTVYRHTFDHKDTRQPITWERKLGTITGTNAEVVDGTVLGKLGFELANGLLAMRTEGPGRKDVLGAASTPTFDTKRPWMKFEGSVKLGGTTTGVRSVKAELERVLVEDDYDVGSRFRQDIDVGAVLARIEAEVMVRDISLLQRSLGGASATEAQADPLYNADEVKFTGPTISGSYKHELTLKFPRTHWKAIGLPMRGKDVMIQRVEGTALYDSSAGHVWQAILDNTQTTI